MQTSPPPQPRPLTPPVSQPLPLTGERTAPGIWHENYWFRRHEAAYLAARRACPAGAGAPVARVLDVGCGEGYGSALLSARTGARVLGLDYDVATLAHARARYPGLDAVAGNAVALPVPDACVDVVVALQVVEHLWDQPAFVAECARVLRPGGTLVLTTPNRLTFSPPGSAPNPFHSRELDAGELTDLLVPCFGAVTLQGLHHGPRLRAWETRHGDLVAAQLATAPDGWPTGLRTLVRAVTARDFVLSDADLAGCRDLFALARAR